MITNYFFIISAFFFILIHGCAPFPSSDSKPNKIRNSVGMEFVYIEPGYFMTGSYSEDFKTKNKIDIEAGFYMQTTEVTQKQWVTVMKFNPSFFICCGENCPVENVSWNDAQLFVLKLNQLEGIKRYRLPDEVEWEYACRAGSSTSFANGKINELGCGHDENLSKIGWYCGNSEVTYRGCKHPSWNLLKCIGPHPVAQKNPNKWCLYDMHGNVFEICNAYAFVNSSNKVIPHLNSPLGSVCVTKGGSWRNSAWSCASENRNAYDPTLRFYSAGFRVVMEKL